MAEYPTKRPPETSLEDFIELLLDMAEEPNKAARIQMAATLGKALRYRDWCRLKNGRQDEEDAGDQQ
jgi:hypothetical protein